MDKIYGTSVRQDGLQQVGRKNFTLFYGLYTDEQGSTYEYRYSFDHRPTWNEVKEVLIEAINEHTQEVITNGFVWNDQRVWLSEENQRNFIMLEKLTSEEYPLTVKINEDTDGSPNYYTFVNEEEFVAFSRLCFQHVIDTLRTGWNEKDSLDPSIFGY